MCYSTTVFLPQKDLQIGKSQNCSFGLEAERRKRFYTSHIIKGPAPSPCAGTLHKWRGSQYYTAGFLGSTPDPQFQHISECIFDE